MYTTSLNIIPPVIAHRGAKSLAPENTLSAFKQAKTLGLNWVEFDVMLAKCGEVVVFHDDTLERTTNGRGNLVDYSYDFLKTLDAGSWFDPSFADEKIPRLSDVLECLVQLGLSANIEIKALPGQEYALVERVATILKNVSLNVLVSSFSREAMRAVTQYLPDVPRGFLMHEWQPDWQLFCDEIKACTVNVNQAILQQAYVDDIKSSERLLLVYTVNSVTLANQLFSLGVDAIFSDCPHDVITKGALYGYDRIINNLRKTTSL